MNNAYIYSLADPQATIETTGGKGASLARLAQAGLPVPDGFHISTSAYQKFIHKNQLQPQILAALEDINIDQPVTLETAANQIEALFLHARIPNEIAEEIAQAYSTLQDKALLKGQAEAPVAVRSSATAEDLPGLSFAGQQDTFLNIQGKDAVLEAVKHCWTSLWTARAIGYRIRNTIDQTTVSLAVIVQILVPAESAGILFTANPLNSRRDQIMINASWGLGEAIVGGQVTPDTLIIAKSSGKVIERQTTEKLVMTALVEGATEIRPVSEPLQHAPVLSDAEAGALARMGLQIEELYGMPMDIEWAIQEGKIFILQARPVTTLGKPEVLRAKPAKETMAASDGHEKSVWMLENPKDQYMRASICELMPNPLSPLFASMGMQAITRGIGIMSNQLLRMPIDTFGNFMQTVNGYAYEKVSFSGRQWWYMLSRMVPAMSRVLREGIGYWQKTAHPQYAAVVARWEAKPTHELSHEELFRGVEEVLDAFGHHLGALMASTMGPAAGSEGLFTQLYEKRIRRPEDPPAPVFLMGFENRSLAGEKSLYDLALWCRERPELAAYLTRTTPEQLAIEWNAGDAPTDVPSETWIAWRTRFADYLDHFGYSIYDMDFASPLPGDNPAQILETLVLFIKGQGKNPYERQAALTEQREAATEVIRSRLRSIKRWAFEKTLGWAQTRAPLREDGLIEIGLGYPVLRRMLHELGRRFTAAGSIDQPEDIFWLEQGEVEQCVKALARGQGMPELQTKIAERKALWQAQKQLTPPPQLPPKSKYMGLDAEKILASRSEQKEAGVIHGTPCSPGCVTGTARVLHGPEDFDQMQPGDILVAGITTPAWTPLFAIAAAVVTDIGGPLSHGSIVAREYGIPAVLGTGVATRQIASGQTITVDGAQGTIQLHTNGNALHPESVEK